MDEFFELENSVLARESVIERAAKMNQCTVHLLRSFARYAIEKKCREAADVEYPNWKDEIRAELARRRTNGFHHVDEAILTQNKNQIKHMNNRIKIPVKPMGRDDAIALLGEIRLATINRNKVCLDREAAVKEIDDRVGPVLALADAEIASKCAMLKAWAELNKTEFGDARSIETLHGTFGFRTGNPTVKPIRPLTWEKILDTLKNLGNGGNYIRTTEEVNKAAILADREALGEINLKKIGVRIVQDTTFFVDAKLDQVN